MPSSTRGLFTPLPSTWTWDLFPSVWRRVQRVLLNRIVKVRMFWKGCLEELLCPMWAAAELQWYQRPLGCVYLLKNNLTDKKDLYFHFCQVSNAWYSSNQIAFLVFYIENLSTTLANVPIELNRQNTADLLICQRQSPSGHQGASIPGFLDSKLPPMVTAFFLICRIKNNGRYQNQIRPLFLWLNLF